MSLPRGGGGRGCDLTYPAWLVARLPAAHPPRPPPTYRLLCCAVVWVVFRLRVVCLFLLCVSSVFVCVVFCCINCLLLLLLFVFVAFRCVLV